MLRRIAWLTGTQVPGALRVATFTIPTQGIGPSSPGEHTHICRAFFIVCIVSTNFSGSKITANIFHPSWFSKMKVKVDIVRVKNVGGDFAPTEVGADYADNKKG